MVIRPAFPRGFARQLALSTVTFAVGAPVESRWWLTICCGERSTGRKRAYPGKPDGVGRRLIRLNAAISNMEMAITQRAARCSITGLPCSVMRDAKAASFFKLSRLYIGAAI